MNNMLLLNDIYIPVEGGVVTKKWTTSSVTGKRPRKKSSPLRRRNSGSNGCPCGYLVNPRRTVRGMAFGADSPRYLATTELVPSHPMRTCDFQKRNEYALGCCLIDENDGKHKVAAVF